ncbi:unnamed protein product [Rotaria magnacalcarata]|uniref:NACHT domain-containing protein n=1 Tax=Rotaria magnacalcarata TaxID=392030 RepID=A0A816T3M9_9BILA|nr:unnamed protein product [Rotaria magnacalcarata]CAF3807718.1 unnamed protein product [Rotaria magnacalcarata]
MIDPSSVVTILVKVIQNAQQLYEQKKKNDEDCKYLIDHLTNKLNTLEGFQNMLAKNEIMKLDEEQKNSWTSKQNRVEQSLKDFQIWISDRNKQCWKAFLCSAGQSENIGSIVQRFDDALIDFNQFLQHIIDCKGLENLNQQTKHLGNLENNANEQIDHLKQIAENTGPSKVQSIFELPQMARHIKKKYQSDPEFANRNKDTLNSSAEECYISLAIVENKEQRAKERKLEMTKDIDELRGTYQEIYGAKTVIEVNDIFKNCKNARKTAILIGRAGVGKSTFCKHVIQQWAKGQLWSEYAVVILIQLRKLTKERYPDSNRYSVLDIVEDEYRLDVKPTDEVKLKFKDQCEQGQILWILDGYDEFQENRPVSLEGPFNDIINQHHHIITSRPYTIDLKYEMAIEIIGFSNDNIVEFVKQYFKANVTTQTDIQSNPDSLINYLKSNPTIWGIAHIPMNLYLICTTWNDGVLENKTLTVTDLYSEMINELCRKYMQRKHKCKPPISERKVHEECSAHLQFLENLAFHALEDNKSILVPKLLTRIIEETKCSETIHEESLKIGVLKSYDDKFDGKRAETEKLQYFIHLSVQEFFAARYLVRALACEIETARHFIQRNKYNQRFTLVFIFAFGLLRRQNKPDLIEKYWNNIEHNAKDIVGLRHVKLLIEGFDEMNGTAYSKIRTGCLNYIATWINRAAKLNYDVVMRHLCDSLMRTITLSNEKRIVKTIRQLLKSTDYTDSSDIKRRACMALRAISPKQQYNQVVDVWLEALNDDDTTVVMRACESLGAIGKTGHNNKVTDALLKELKNKDQSVRLRACVSLGIISNTGDNNKVIDTLLKELQKEKPKITHMARRAVRSTRNTKYTLRVTDVLSEEPEDDDDDDVDVRAIGYRAFRAIGKSGYNNKIIDALLETLRDSWQLLREIACEFLLAIGKTEHNDKLIDALLEALKANDDEDVKVSACAALKVIATAEHNHKVIDALLKAITDGDYRIKGCACRALGVIGKTEPNSRIINGLLEALNDRDSWVRMSACDALGGIGKTEDNSKIIDALLETLKDDSSQVRERACKALGAIVKIEDGHTVIDALLEALKDITEDVKESACEVIRVIVSTENKDKIFFPLLEVVKKNLNKPKRSAYKILEEMGNTEYNNKVIDTLVEAVKSGESTVRRSACEFLGEIDMTRYSNKVINALLQALKDKDVWVRTNACGALEAAVRIENNSKVIDALLEALHDDYNDVRVSACKILGEIGKTADHNRVINALFEALNDKYDDVRKCAYEALGGIGKIVDNYEIIDVLLEILIVGNRDMSRIACDALGVIGNTRDNNQIIDGLLKALTYESHDGRQRACDTLKAIGKAGDNNRIVSALCKTLKDQRYDVREAACYALGAIGKAGNNNKVIYTLLRAFSKKTVGENAIQALNPCLHDVLSLEMLNDKYIKILESWVINEKSDLKEIPASLCARSYFESRNEVWLPLTFLTALLQSVAVTIGDNNAFVYGATESIVIENISDEYLEKLKIAFEEQQEKL